MYETWSKRIATESLNFPILKTEILNADMCTSEQLIWDVRGVMDTFVGNGHGNMGANSEWDCLHFK